ncbi:diaminopimelate epimerase [Bacillus ndiopicus]|uniref:hypothetical protein n=1 Tax=Bacillus ndiopicus TaxID=1347368 RepID=UPI0005A8E1BB|nr:hypothetical protein [Bacillus ndiopicus]
MKLNFVKISPSKNMTILITNYIDPAQYSYIAKTLMDYEYINAEQLGFLVTPKSKDSLIRLEMSGGEFCGNALLAAASYCHYNGLTEQRNFLLETSGAESPLACLVEATSSNYFKAKAEMPEPLSIRELTFDLNGRNISGSCVQLDGITHFLTDYWPSQDDFNLIIEEVSKRIENKAIGIIPYRRLRENDYEIWPFVYVKETGSQFFEQACGSGSLALGIYLAKGIEDKFNIHQPGGVINVETGAKNYISTDVRFTCEGFAEID